MVEREGMRLRVAHGHTVQSGFARCDEADHRLPLLVRATLLDDLVVDRDLERRTLREIAQRNHERLQRAHEVRAAGAELQLDVRLARRRRFLSSGFLFVLLALALRRLVHRQRPLGVDAANDLAVCVEREPGEHPLRGRLRSPHIRAETGALRRLRHFDVARFLRIGEERDRAARRHEQLAQHTVRRPRSLHLAVEDEDGLGVLLGGIGQLIPRLQQTRLVFVVGFQVVRHTLMVLPRLGYEHAHRLGQRTAGEHEQFERQAECLRTASEQSADRDAGDWVH